MLKKTLVNDKILFTFSEVINTRLERVWQILQANKLDCIVIKNRTTIRYLTGFTGDAGFVYLGQDKKVLITDGRFIQQAKLEVKDFEIFIYSGNIWQAIANFAKINQRIGFDGAKFSYKDFQELKNVLPNKDLQSVELADIRVVKDVQELNDLKKAAEIADKAFDVLLNKMHSGMTELQLATELEYNMRLFGSEKVSFDTIVASGCRSAMPHGLPSNKIVEKGDFVTFDFGAVYNGYHSDMTRTVVVGKATSWHKEIYEAVAEAQNLGVQMAKVGMLGSELDTLCRKVIEDKGYGKYFNHGLGHGVGLEIHEFPNINKAGQEKLSVNMVFTIEPGIYIPDKGGVRIEDTVVLTEKGAKALNGIERQLIEIA